MIANSSLGLRGAGLRRPRFERRPRGEIHAYRVTVSRADVPGKHNVWPGNAVDGEGECLAFFRVQIAKGKIVGERLGCSASAPASTGPPTSDLGNGRRAHRVSRRDLRRVLVGRGISHGPVFHGIFRSRLSQRRYCCDRSKRRDPDRLASKMGDAAVAGGGRITGYVCCEH